MYENGTISIEDLFLIIKSLESKIDSLQKQLSQLSASTPQKEWFTLEELREYLPSHPSESTIRRMVKDKTIPTYRSGKRLLFRREDVDEWLNGSKATPTSNHEKDAICFLSRTHTTCVAPWRQHA